MNEVLQPGQVVRAITSGAVCRVEEFLGGGNQGQVYRATLGGGVVEGSPEVALKWYLPGAATGAQRTTIEGLVQGGPPDRRFLWPVDLAEAPGTPGFGYLMPLRPPRYKGIVDLMKRRTEPTFRTPRPACTSPTATSSCMPKLCYRDISFGNVFFDPHVGDVPDL